MNDSTLVLPADAAGTEVTRFNALRHGVLSRYTVLPWEDAEEYHAVVEALVAEHRPHGPTEEHLVEELAEAPTALGRSRCPPARAGWHALVIL